MSLHLQSNSIYTNQLNTDNFARMLKDPSQCYKFYWLEAILTLMETTEGDLSFDAIIDEMICAAWYSVVNYHLHLGPTMQGKSGNYHLSDQMISINSDYGIKVNSAKFQGELAKIK